MAIRMHQTDENRAATALALSCRLRPPHHAVADFASSEKERLLMRHL